MKTQTTAITDRFILAQQVARQAGALAKGYFENLATLTVHSKGVQDMATEADLNTEQLIRAELARHYPDDLFLGEETYQDFVPEAGRGAWVVDPIDGTQPFISGIPSWCIAIAYVEQNRIELGVIYDPVHDELFAAQRGCGALLNGAPLHTSEATDLGGGLVGIGYSTRVLPEATLAPMARLLAAKGMFHRCGSGALSIAYVAAGRMIGYFEPHMNSWDALAGILITCEAGGRAEVFLQNEHSLQKGAQVLVAAPGVFTALQAVVQG